MRRSLATLPALALLIAFAPAAPVPRKPTLYYATKEGAKWVYDDSGQERTFVVTRAEDKYGGKVVYVTEERGDGRQHPVDEMVEVSEHGLFLCHFRSTMYVPHLCLLRLPHKPGDAWDFQIYGSRLLGTRTAREAEPVEVPAGKFTAVPVVFEGQYAGRPCKHTFWYAPAVGLVKSDCGPYGVRVLKSFSPGHALLNPALFTP
jgi:hypothetical protein